MNTGSGLSGPISLRACLTRRVIAASGNYDENQFGRTNHGHLGQILTYLAGIENAKTVVWIAQTIQPDHRAAVDWLNSNTTDEFSFFAMENETLENRQFDVSPSV